MYRANFLGCDFFENEASFTYQVCGDIVIIGGKPSTRSLFLSLFGVVAFLCLNGDQASAGEAGAGPSSVVLHRDDEEGEDASNGADDQLGRGQENAECRRDALGGRDERRRKMKHRWRMRRQEVVMEAET